MNETMSSHQNNQFMSLSDLFIYFHFRIIYDNLHLDGKVVADGLDRADVVEQRNRQHCAV